MLELKPIIKPVVVIEEVTLLHKLIAAQAKTTDPTR